IVADNKVDMPGAREGLVRLSEALPDRRVIGTSTVTNEGVPTLLTAVAEALAALPKPVEPAPETGVRVYRLAPEQEDGFHVEVEEAGLYRVRGKRGEGMGGMTDL